MSTWLLSWNPKNWEWSTFYQDRAATASGQLVKESWRCSNGAATNGDNVYLVRTGEDPRGIMAHGIITEKPHEAPHYDLTRAAKGETNQVIGIDIDEIRDPAQDDFLSITTLEKEIDPSQTWNPQSSGIEINDHAAKALEGRWSQLAKPNLRPLSANFLEDCRVLAKYEHAGQGAWTTMPEADKASYLKIHAGLQQILASTVGDLPADFSLDKCLTLGFNTKGGVRGNRPKDLWCAVFPRDAGAYMPQVFLIVSHRGVELGYAAAIHSSDFSNQDFKQKLKQLAPRIFDALPDPTSLDAQSLSEQLSQQAVWYFRKKTRLQPRENDFGGLEDLLSFLKSAEGKAWGSGVIARYWLPHEVAPNVDLSCEFRAAVKLFKPLMVSLGREAKSPSAEMRPAGEEHWVDGIRADLERFMEMYPERRSRPFGTDQELWALLRGL